MLLYIAPTNTNNRNESTNAGEKGVTIVTDVVIIPFVLLSEVEITEQL